MFGSLDVDPSTFKVSNTLNLYAVGHPAFGSVLVTNVLFGIANHTRLIANDILKSVQIIAKL